MHTYIHIQTIHAILTYAFWGVHMHTYIHMHTIHAHTDICILGYTYALYVCVHMYTSNTCNTTCYFQYIHICTGRITDEQGERVRVGGGPQGQASVRETFTRGDGRDAENPSVGGEVTRRELCQGLKGVAPRQAGAKRMQEGVESRWLLVRWEVPEYAGGQE